MKKNKILVFECASQEYRVDELGRINANGIGHHSDDWIFIGGSSHHWHGRPTVSLADAFARPAVLNGCYGWDRDHGTTRTWRGRKGRIQHARIEQPTR